MKAYVRTSSQDQNVELADMPIPEIAADEVLVSVQAFGVGIHDRFFIPADAKFPYTIGTEASGIVTDRGRDVTRFNTRDRVMLTSVLQPKGGCWAEYVAVPQSRLIPLPAKMEFAAGAAIPIAGGTALASMRALDLSAGDTLFVAGASGAIGTLVIQLAAQQGIHVAGSASRKNHDYMLSLGAEKVVDYTEPNWKESIIHWQPGGVTAALAIQPGTVADSVDVVKDGGKVVTVSGDRAESKRNISVFQFQHQADPEQQALVKLVSDIATGRIRLIIEHVYPFE
ncbi:MAG: NADP-dependent oxidoreductase, partial [Gemmatimonadaceae bacterium]